MHSPISRVVVLFLLLPALLCAASSAAQDPDFRRAPWKSDVSSSSVLQANGATIQVDFAPGDLDLSHQDVLRWIDTAAKAVSCYYGKFPVDRARVLVVPIANQRGVRTGTTWGGVGGFTAFTRMRLGQHTTSQDLQNDWTMTHEFVHIGFPSMPDENHWLEEGLATYIEPIARVQIGTLTAEQIWSDMHRDMRKGEPAQGDEGLDRTHTWASTYWGGALFCLRADVQIRRATANRKGLQDALRGIVAVGGTIDHDWPIAKALEAGDKATGTTVLSTLYEQMGNRSEATDLDALWNELGIRAENGKIVFDSAAPSAKIREKITASTCASNIASIQPESRNPMITVRCSM